MSNLKQKSAFIIEGKLVEELHPLCPVHRHEGGVRWVHAHVHGRIVLIEDEPDGLPVALAASLRHVLELVRTEQQSVRVVQSQDGESEA